MGHHDHALKMKRIIHITGDQVVSTIWRGEEYLVDGQPATVEPPLHLLTDIDRPAGAINTATHRLRFVPAHADLETGEWVLRSWEAVALTPDELAARARKTWPNASAFLGEFSMPELAAISLSADPTIAALRLLLASWPSDVWSDDARIVMGLAALVSAGIIDETRSAEITAK
jgi:hypothetical protein